MDFRDEQVVKKPVDHYSTMDGKKLPKDLTLDKDGPVSQVPFRGDRSEMRASSKLAHLQTQ